MSTVHEHDEGRRSRSRPPKLTISDYAIGICLLTIVVLLWTTSNFVTQYMFTSGYRKPFMMTYLSTASFVVYLVPAYFRKLLTGSLSRQRNISYQPLAQDFSVERDPLATQLLHESDDRLTPQETAKLAACFCFLWFAANWTLNVALGYTSVASATVLSGMSGIFTLAVARIFHVETLTLLKVSAVLTSFGGVVLVSLSDSSSNPVSGSAVNARPVNLVAIMGDILALLSALFYAVYMVFLKVQIKEESRIDMQLFFGYVGFFGISLCWPALLVLHLLGVESLEFPGTGQVVFAILVNMLITVSSDYIYVIAMLKTTPLVATIGLSLTIPLAVVGDYFLGKPATLQVLSGGVLVAGAFIVVGIENSKSKESDVVLAQDIAGESMGRQTQRRSDETVPLESQANASDA